MIWTIFSWPNKCKSHPLCPKKKGPNKKQKLCPIQHLMVHFKKEGDNCITRRNLWVKLLCWIWPQNCNKRVSLDCPQLFANLKCLWSKKRSENENKPFFCSLLFCHKSLNLLQNEVIRSKTICWALWEREPILSLLCVFKQTIHIIFSANKPTHSIHFHHFKWQNKIWIIFWVSL